MIEAVYKLRSCQQRCHEDCMEYMHSKSDRPVLAVAPTAFGKSLSIGHLTNEISSPVLTLSISKELLEQNLAKLRAFGGEASVYSASLNTKEFGHNTYATLGSVKNIGKEFRARGVETLLIDEAHAGFDPKPGSMFRRFVEDLKPKKVIGFTATPIRLRQYLGGYSQLNLLTKNRPAYFKDIIHVTQISEMVENNWWSKLVYETHVFNENKLLLNSSGAEFTDESINKSVEEQGINERILDRVRELSKTRNSILVFCSSVSVAEDMASKTPHSACVSSNTSGSVRDSIIKAFKSGLIKVVYNYSVLGIGFDHPALDTILMGRPTNSLAVWYQYVGRGSRICEGKNECLIVDYCNNVKRFGMLETLTVEDVEGYGWGVFNGDYLLSNCPMHLPKRTKFQLVEGKNPTFTKLWFGKHSGLTLDKVPADYLQWMKREFKFDTPKMKALEAELNKFSL